MDECEVGWGVGVGGVLAGLLLSSLHHFHHFQLMNAAVGCSLRFNDGGRLTGEATTLTGGKPGESSSFTAPSQPFKHLHILWLLLNLSVRVIRAGCGYTWIRLYKLYL